MNDRTLTVADHGERDNLAAFVSRALRLDEAAVVRLRRRPDGRVGAWTATGFDALAARVVDAELRPDDITVAADTLARSLASGNAVDLGFSMDSAWRGALPPAGGFAHVDDVPARVLVDLAQRGAALAADHGSSHGPPASLLDQNVIEVSGGEERIGIPMRVVFALIAMGFVPHSGDDPADPDAIDAAELVRVRATRSWLRLDARFGSVSRRRGGELPVMPL